MEVADDRAPAATRLRTTWSRQARRGLAAVLRRQIHRGTANTLPPAKPKERSVEGRRSATAINLITLSMPMKHRRGQRGHQLREVAMLGTATAELGSAIALTQWHAGKSKLVQAPEAGSSRLSAWSIIWRFTLNPARPAKSHAALHPASAPASCDETSSVFSTLSGLTSTCSERQSWARTERRIRCPRNC